MSEPIIKMKLVLWKCLVMYISALETYLGQESRIFDGIEAFGRWVPSLPDAILVHLFCLVKVSTSPFQADLPKLYHDEPSQLLVQVLQDVCCLLVGPCNRQATWFQWVSHQMCTGFPPHTHTHDFSSANDKLISLCKGVMSLHENQKHWHHLLTAPGWQHTSFCNMTVSAPNAMQPVQGLFSL